MRTTFSCVLCVLLVAACLAQTSPKESKTDSLLKQAIKHVQLLIRKDYDMFLHSPTNNIKECCSQSAFECFRKELASTFLKNSTKNDKDPVKKLGRNLSKPTIVNSVNICTEEQIKEVECTPCSYYPKVNGKQFLTNLQFLLQKAYSRLP